MGLRSKVEDRVAQYQELLDALKKGKPVVYFGDAEKDNVVGKMKEFCDADIVITRLPDIDPDGMTGLPLMSKEAHERRVAQLNSTPKYSIKLK